MFVSSLDVINDPELPAKLKSWAGHLNLAAKKADVATFKIIGSPALQCRGRNSKGYTKNSAHQFEGGEEFRLSSIVIEKSVERDGVTILTMFTPVSLALTQEVASMCMPFDEAVIHFEGFEAWTHVSDVEPNASATEKARISAELEKLPTVEATRESEKWGAW